MRRPALFVLTIFVLFVWGCQDLPFGYCQSNADDPRCLEETSAPGEETSAEFDTSADSSDGGAIDTNTDETSDSTFVDAGEDLDAGEPVDTMDASTSDTMDSNDVSAPDTTVADTSKPNTSIIADTKPDVAPDTGTDTTVAPDTGMPDTMMDTLDTFVPDTFVPDTFVPDTFVPDTFVPDTFVPDTCASVSCTSPPAAFCFSASVLRTHAAAGTCIAGSCMWQGVAGHVLATG